MIEDLPFEDVPVGQPQPVNFTVKPSKELFDEMRSLQNRMRSLSGLISNHMVVSYNDIEQTRREIKSVRDEIQQWWSKVLIHIDKCNE